MREFRPGSFQILPPIIKNLLIINVLMFIARQTIQTATSTPMDDLLSLHTWQSPLFKPWQFVTHLFMHGSVAHIFSNMFALWMFGSVLENLWGPKKFLTFYLVCGLGAALMHMTVLYFETNSLLESYNALQQHFNFSTFEHFFSKEHIADYVQNSNYTEIFNQYKNNSNNPLAAQQASILAQNFVDARLNDPTLGASGAIFGCLAAFGSLFPNTYLYIYFFLPLKAQWIVIICAGF